MSIMRSYVSVIHSPAMRRFMKYAGVGFGTFCFDLAILALSVEVFGLSLYVATPLCFVIAVSLNYLISRAHVFRGTARNLHTGYGYFILAAGAGALMSTSGVAFLVLTFSLHYLVARTAVAGCVGILTYLINLHFNFKVVGLHH